MIRCKLRHLEVVTQTSISNTALEELSAHGAAIVSLCVPYASRVVSVSTVASSLRKLDASGSCGIDDAGLAQATRIVEFNAACNPKIRTVAPFAGSLRKLDAGVFCGIDDAGLAEATRIVELNAADNPKIRTVAPFASSLRKLVASEHCGIDDAGLAQATRIVFLRDVTALAPPHPLL